MLYFWTIKKNPHRQWHRVQKQNWTEVFKKLRTEQKFTPIYSPQCNGGIEGFHKFLKAMIAKQLETHMEWDDLVWKATVAYNFFPTESSGLAPFFLMFGHEAAVKYTLLESEKPKISRNKRRYDQRGINDQTVQCSSTQLK